MAKLAPDLELLRMGLTFPEVMELAWRDPCWLLTSQTARALLGVAMTNPDPRHNLRQGDIVAVRLDDGSYSAPAPVINYGPPKSCSSKDKPPKPKPRGEWRCSS